MPSSSTPIDACQLHIPHTEQVCAWLMQHAGLKTVDLERARRLSQEGGDAELLGLLTRLGLVSEVELARAWADLLGAPLLLADAAPPLLDPLPVLTERFMHHYQVVPVGWSQGGLRVLAANPSLVYPFQAIAYACGVPVWLAVGPRNEVETLIERYYGQGRSAMGTLIENLDEQGSALEDIEHLKDMASEAPVIRLVNLILQRAVEHRASDIHIEPFENQLKVRYRIDGVLHEAEAPPSSSSAAVISRVKIMARLDIAERRLPQDGRIMLRIQGKELDLRVSTVPTSFGESVVMRLLDRQTVQFDFQSLGFDGQRLETFLEVLERPHGILLVTGPTGSGKTTTLYTALSRLNTAERKIITVEDPVEYQLEGINQIQVKPAIGLDFAGALRSIVRQDPDVIMIGEIRDLETCRIAIQSSLTGHLVLSTLHTNSAAASITRLLDMGVESYLIASTVNGILAQRLVRRLDPATREAFEAPAELIAEHGLDRFTELRPILLYRPRADAPGGGYHGRSAITELLVMNDELRSLLMRQADAATLEQAARRGGLRTLHEEGLRQAVAGVTSLEEVLRVTRGEGA
ncbi:MULTISPECIES: type II secretion system ATPase GspE [Pseudomonas]|uniref:type II secretion system ATPase GspE n=1 Tax=Pseudomonas TaxID=286 RepID=UPI000C88657A|nr:MULTISPECIES: type II secretion system ATPase GspE [unclassified Pseudomonas]PMX19322.1 type II secretion system protein GspE [Pseudomonas sp. GW460-12]PMX37102.1 type II secretion system protein GspE [Pseudomonas sp. MPR-R2A4]PMX43189.1 type II secretion system protein GspE [Pseudomonas sp. MPR-R2A7]PMX55289.1 type II secretion system protein GspE [Pseudomonas sp. MPR-R2A6]PMX92797.1 type II secretion system protein GspE [Pseudomonas sp. MPR-R2A3]